MYNRILESGMKNTKYLAAETMDSGAYCGFKPEEIQTIVDFIFVDKATVKPVKFRVINKKYDGRFYSDHYAIYSDIELK